MFEKWKLYGDQCHHNLSLLPPPTGESRLQTPGSCSLPQCAVQETFLWECSMAFSCPATCPQIQARRLTSRSKSFPMAARSGDSRIAELAHGWLALLSSLLQDAPSSAIRSFAFTAHSGQTVDRVTGGCRERLGPYHCPVEGDDQCPEEREEDVGAAAGTRPGLGKDANQTRDQHLGRNIPQGGGQ